MRRRLLACDITLAELFHHFCMLNIAGSLKLMAILFQKVCS